MEILENWVFRQLCGSHRAKTVQNFENLAVFARKTYNFGSFSSKIGQKLKKFNKTHRIYEITQGIYEKTQGYFSKTQFSANSELVKNAEFCPKKSLSKHCISNVNCLESFVPAGLSACLQLLEKNLLRNWQHKNAKYESIKICTYVRLFFWTSLRNSTVLESSGSLSFFQIFTK